MGRRVDLRRWSVGVKWEVGWKEEGWLEVWERRRRGEKE